MNILIGSKELIAEKVNDYLIDKINKKPKIYLGLPTGSTPLLLYDNLIKSYNNKKVSFKTVTTFNLDEYIGIDINSPNSYHYYMNNNFFNYIDINKENAHVPLDDPEQYEKLINENGIDILILGLGRNGHIGFNEPGTSFSSTTHITDLSEETRNDNSRLFNSINEVPKQAITMGLSTIMKAKKIIIIAFGVNKAQAVYKLIKGQITEDVPCSILKNHPNCTLCVDKEAFSLINKDTIKETYYEL